MDLDLQPGVAREASAAATFCSVSSEIKASDYWRLVCAPKLRRAKGALGEEEPAQADLSEAVFEESGKKGKRAAVGHFLTGEREPYFSQFIALCRKLEVDPLEVLGPPIPPRVPLARADVSVKPAVRKTRLRKKQ